MVTNCDDRNRDWNRDQHRNRGEEEKAGRAERIDYMVRPAGIEPATLSLEG